MSPQMRLPGVDPPRQIQPVADRRTPVFWVRRLRVLRELKPGNEHIVRDVPLRRGLNVVWAPAHPVVGKNALFQNGVAGHTAGKTMFCRLVRHVLGERGLAAEATRRRIRSVFPDGWVAAEVVINDEPWTVARPFAVGAHPFCLQGGTLQEVATISSRQAYQVFLDALGAAVLSGMRATQFPVDGESVGWGHVLPWLSRDQECRYSDFLDWRHSSSGAEAPALDADERQFLVRAVLGLISDEERAEQSDNARLVTKKRDAAQRAPLLSHQAEVDRKRVASELGVDLPPPSTPLFGSQAREELAARLADLDERDREAVIADRRTELRAALETAIAFEVNARRDLDACAGELDLEQAALAELTGHSQAALLEGLPPSREHCGVRMSVAREHGCPLASTRPVAIAEHRSARTAAEELKEKQSGVRQLRSVVDREQSRVSSAAAAVSMARKDVMVADTAFEEWRGRSLLDRARLVQIEQMIAASEEAWKDAATQAEMVLELEREIVDSYARQKQLRQDGRDAVDRFSTTFDYVVRAILGDEVTGRADTSGRSLALVVEEHGERDSAAIETVKLLAFDLAALVSSAEGFGAFPRFLIHDGPREADMASDIYDRLFLFARELEKCFDGEPSFQYIVTTTTAPPAECATEPILRLTLAGVPAAERFLRCDL